MAEIAAAIIVLGILAFVAREYEVVAATRQGLWNPELRNHVSGCTSWREVQVFPL